MELDWDREDKEERKDEDKKDRHDVHRDQLFQEDEADDRKDIVLDRKKRRWQGEEEKIDLREEKRGLCLK